MSTPRSDELLFAAGGDVWEKYGTFVKRTLPEEERGTFSRSSDATYTDRSGSLRTAESGVLRPHYVSSESSYSARLEAARTNSITRSEEFDHGDWGGTATITADDAMAPDGTATADKIEDTDGSGFQSVVQALSGQPDDSKARAASVFVKKQSSFSTTVEFQLTFEDGSTQIFYAIQLNPADGSTAERADSPDRFGVEDYNSDWWRLWVVGSNNGTGNTTYKIKLNPAINASGADGTADSGATGTQHVWGAQLEGLSGGADFPSSYVATAGSAVSRAADDLTSSANFGTQDLTTYLKFVERMSADTANIGLLALGGDIASTTGAHFGIEHQSSSREYRLLIGDGDGNFGLEASVNPSVSIGDVVEIAAGVDGGDSFIEVSVNGGTITSDTRSISHPFDADRFHNDQLVVGGRGPSAKLCMADFISGPIIAPGVRTMDEMRSIEV